MSSQLGIDKPIFWTQRLLGSSTRGLGAESVRLVYLSPFKGPPLMIWGAEKISDANFFSLWKPFLNCFTRKGIFRYFYFFGGWPSRFFFPENVLQNFFSRFSPPPRSLMVIPLLNYLNGYPITNPFCTHVS